MTERRRYKRYDFAHRVVYATMDNPRKRHKTHSVNISLGGIQLIIDKFIERKKYLKLYISKSPIGRPIQVIGKIVWQGRFTDLAEDRAGVQFMGGGVNFEDRATQKIKALIERTA